MTSNWGDENDFIECDKDTSDKIKLKLMDIHEVFNITNIDCNFSEKGIDYNSIGYNEAKTRLDIYENISKLSVYIMHDYEFFVKCTIKSAFKCPIYNTAMEKLGYQRHGSNWTLYLKPSQEIIIDSIFKYCLYSYIVQKKNQDYKKSNSYQPFPKKTDYHNDEQRRNQRPMRKEQFENQRDQSYYRKQERSFSYEDNNMKYKQKNEDMRNKINRDDKVDRVYVTRKQNDNQNNFDNYPPNIKCVERPPNNEVSKKWKCKVCEMMNSFQLLCCEACDNKRPSSGKWACPKCTCLNELNNVNCEVCATELK